jgi:RNA polymerase sigma-70 factor (ECF subfamily)
MPDDVDRGLLDHFVRGDPEAFEQLFRQFEIEVYRWILRIVRDASAAEDVMVEAFWRAYRARARFDASRSFGAWMRRIATNAALDHLRRSPPGLWTTRVDTLPAPVQPDPALSEAIAIAFRRLPPRLQIVASLALIEGQSYADIAEALDLPTGTVKSRVFRAVAALKKELALLGLQP